MIGTILPSLRRLTGERLFLIVSPAKTQAPTELSAFDRYLARDDGTTPLSDRLLGIQLWAVPLQCTSLRFISASLRLLIQSASWWAVPCRLEWHGPRKPHAGRTAVSAQQRAVYI